MKHYQHLIVEHKDHIVRVTINRPEFRNALNGETLQEIDKVLDWAESDEEIRMIIFQGAGDKSFAAGADIKQLHERSMLEALLPGMHGLYKKIEKLSKVTIAAVTGYAIGGGCELALSCDLRIATKKAKFALPELNLGIIPGAGGTQRLARMIGKGRAMDMILTGKMISGEEAEKIGLVSYLAEEEGLENVIEAVTKEILKKGPIAVKLAKLAVHNGYDADLETAMLIEKLSQAIAFATEDKKEGTLAFLEKRQAEFRQK
ncbi:enoyl-CoA hydratase/isomerase family protein [Bacillaceae bacterium Marseille-Q3522]|nr:enoyl-CoA hydratase/isomerase family protein [Bacillaceae bacterium Marseille-Q3522]